MPIPTPASSEPALVGLAAKLEATGVTQYALATWLGVTAPTVRRWVRGENTGGRHIELLHDWIEGRIVAKRVTTRSWVFVAAEEVMTPEERDLLALVQAVRDGRAVVRFHAGGAEIVLRNEGGDLTEAVSESSIGDMQHASRYEPRRPDERMIPTTLRWYPSDEATADAIAAKLGVARAVVIRRALRDMADRLQLAG